MRRGRERGGRSELCSDWLLWFIGIVAVIADRRIDSYGAMIRITMAVVIGFCKLASC